MESIPLRRASESCLFRTFVDIMDWVSYNWGVYCRGMKPVIDDFFVS